MIIVLHGDDLNSSYNRLQTILTKFQHVQHLKLSNSNSKEDLINALLTTDMFEPEKIIICENFISSQKIKANDFKGFPKDAHLIFWEQKQLSPSIASKLKSAVQIEIFKEQPQVFWFLDSISPFSQNTLAAFNKIDSPNEKNITYHLANRMFLLILAKLQIKRETASQIAGKPMADWQWQKIQNQARNFSLTNLAKIFKGVLRLDSLIKSGLTGHKPSTLVPILLVKYLRS